VINIDEDQRNADWIKTTAWEFSIDRQVFLWQIGGEQNLKHFLTLPVAEAMPLSLRLELGIGHSSKTYNLMLDAFDAFGFPVKFDPGQERDENGRWTSGGSIGVVETVPASPKFPDPRELPTYGLTPAAQEALYAKCEARGVTHEALTNEIASRIGGPDAAVLTQAGEWYPQAHDLATTMATESNGRISQEQAEAVIAAISPRENWDANVIDAQRITDFYSSGAADGMTPEQAVLAMRDAQPGGEQFRALPDNMVKAVEVLQGTSPDEALAGLKVRSFYDNIDDPGGTREVTIDGHMLKAFSAVSDTITDKGATQLLNQSSRTEGAQYAGAGYIAISEAVRSVSTQWGVPPDTVQAAYWLSVRDLDWDEMKS
jgi:hypothetical protein